MKVSNQKNRLAGFTLVELVMVIVILAVLAAVSLPKFVNLKAKALDNADYSVMAALGMALKTDYFKNIASGLDPSSAWYTASDFFTKMQTPPPYSVVASWAADSQDNVTWRIVDWGAGYYIACPHSNSSYIPGNLQTTGQGKGKVWIYYYTDFSPYKKGDFMVLGNFDYSH